MQAATVVEIRVIVGKQTGSGICSACAGRHGMIVLTRTGMQCTGTGISLALDLDIMIIVPSRMRD